MTNPAVIQHPGVRIRAEVVPKGMTVTEAARLTGVSRPALSNLLNGKAALSAEMATRLEKAFNFPRQDLLEMQAQYYAALASKKNAPAEILAYVPPFLGIQANKIEEWVTNNITARTRLSVFLRTLVNSTVRALTKVDFPGNDDSERPGWDGFVEALEGSPWVPAGRSGWEFGTNSDIKQKADKDYGKSIKALQQAEREEITFVFVTPRRWARKAKWVEAAKANREWKDVRAYDATDLEQWLEQSLPGQAWFANETEIPADHVRSLDQCWRDWSEVSKPPLSGSLFDSAIEASTRVLLSRLTNTPSESTIIAADSTDEALAFLAQALGERGGEKLAAYRDRVLVFDKPGILPRLASGSKTFIPVVLSREVEREMASSVHSMHTIVVYPRNAVNVDPHIVLDPIGRDMFDKALKEMGMESDEIVRLASESGMSLTVLRRRIATAPAVKTPVWAGDAKTAVSLVPFALVGAWNSANEADRLSLSALAGGKSYPELEREFQFLALLNDVPVWSIGIYRGVISKLDLLYAIASSITREDLTLFFFVARKVLGEDDPALDLEEDKRWLAQYYGKTRQFSSAFRRGISETMVLFAVHAKLFKDRIRVDTEGEAVQVVRDLLLSPLTTRILEANESDLPTYAEAAPSEFLSILEHDLKTDSPAILGLLRPVGTDMFSRPNRSGLLWALEGLSWNPETLPRAVLILAQLAQVEINDNWSNKPINSLKAIFRAWMPQTGANHGMRVDLVKRLAEKFPDIAWKICVDQFGRHSCLGEYSHKPCWRPDGYGFGEPFKTRGPVHDFQREMVEMALNWQEHTLATLSDLVERLQSLDVSCQARVWQLIDTWAKDKADDGEKGAMREKIRVFILLRRKAGGTKLSDDLASLTSKARGVYAALEPDNLLDRHSWLFLESWIQESADEIEIDDINHEKRFERMNKLRINALREICEVHGVEGVVKIAHRGNASSQIGWLVAREILSVEQLKELLRLAMQSMLEGKDGSSTRDVEISFLDCTS